MASSRQTAIAAGPHSESDTEKDDVYSAANGYAALVGDWKALETSSEDSSSRLSYSSDSVNNDVDAHTAASQLENLKVTSAPPVASPASKPKHSNVDKPRVDAPGPSGASSASGGAKPEVYVQPTIDYLTELPKTKKRPNFFVRTTVPEGKGPPKMVHWNRRHFLPEMELQTSPEGALMRPALSFRLTNLVEDCQYNAWLTFTDLKGKTCVGQYGHPQTPRPGAMWEGRVLTFDQLMLYTDDGSGQPKRPVTLKSGERYLIQMNLGLVDEYGRILARTVVPQINALDQSCRWMKNHYYVAWNFRMSHVIATPPPLATSSWMV
ncbi:hypothetical protein HPB50_006031 [Hyalomma asiaticum]|uniref:Uncharacterized protein n=1 Tax=Hyalomma asiaticum TaxID=266040 RepID=A0ACB7S0J2_HYAAI|nr:hypothetical protein HPB50_006031 [Hyalomma asiaticum]